MNYTLKILLLSSSLLVLSYYPSFGQDKKDKIETMHIAYLTQRLDLTTDEAQKFWPLYNEFRSGMDALHKLRRENGEMIKNAGGVDNLSDKDVQNLVASETDIETKELELRKDYVVKFQQVLSLRKVAKLFIAEEQFKRYLLNQLSKRREREEN